MKQLHGQIKPIPVEVLEVRLGIDALELGEGGLEIGQVVDVDPLCGSGGAVELEDLEDLVDLTVSAEERLLFDQFCEDAAHCPNVHSQTVLLLAQKHLGRPVPQSLNFVSESLDGQAEGTGKAKISNFESAHLVNQQILRLEVPVDDPPGVAVVEAVAQLVEEQLHLIGSHRLLVLAHVFLEIVVDKFKDKIQFLLCGNIDHFAETE